MDISNPELFATCSFISTVTLGVTLATGLEITFTINSQVLFVIDGAASNVDKT